MGRTPPATTLEQGAAAPAFQVLLRKFDDWAAVQKRYDADQIDAFRAKLVDNAERLTGDEYESFLDDLHSRLQVLLSAEAREARDWLDRMVAVSAPKKVNQIKAKLPDVARLTASQIEDQIDEFDRRLAAQDQQYNAFNGDRKRTIKQQQTASRRQAEASRAARKAAERARPELGANQTNVAPREKTRWTPRQPVYRSHDLYTPLGGGGYAPYSPNLGPSYSPYRPNLGGYRW
jgi:hypothetical protein